MVPVPKSRLARLARVTAAGVRARAGQSAEVAELLGALRGFPAKLGQIAAYVDGVVPHDGEAWAASLGALFADGPRSDPAEIRRLIEAELGAPVGRLFTRFEDEPIASASIGQVHRAQLADGRVVAVKVQHPGVAEAIQSDVGNLGLAGRAAALLRADRLNAGLLIGELAAHLRQELDYRAEAANQERFRAFHAGDSHIRVPAVIAERSASRVLTTEFVDGLDLAVAAEAPEAERATWCQTLWRFVYKGAVLGGMFNADPHPGNYRFGPRGQVFFLDFGCVEFLNDVQMSADEALHRAALAGDELAFAAAVGGLLGLRGGPQHTRAVGQLRAMFEPLFRSPFRITRPFAAGLLRQMGENTAAARRSREPLAPLPKGALMMNRLQFGFYSVLARLDAEVDYAAIERAFLGAE